MNDISCHLQAEENRKQCSKKFADARILPFYMELTHSASGEARPYELVASMSIADALKSTEA